MNFDTIVGPAVVAAVVSGLISAIAMVVNRSTSLTTHREKINADHELAEKKVSGDLKIAERKFELDRRLADWKRKTEIAEQVLADFYKAKDIFSDARRPFANNGEGSSRPGRGDGETENQTNHNDAIYAPYERLVRERDFFSEMHARRFRFMALFGERGAEPFLVFSRAFDEVGISTFGLLRPARMSPLPDKIRDKYEAAIGWGTDDEDKLAARLNDAVAQVESLCGPVLRDMPEAQ